MIEAAEQARLMAVKVAVVQTTNTPGFIYIQQLADNIVKKTIDEALDEEDPIKRDAKTLKASALRKGFAELFKAVEETKNLNFQPVDDSGFGELELEDEETSTKALRLSAKGRHRNGRINTRATRSNRNNVLVRIKSVGPEGG